MIEKVIGCFKGLFLLCALALIPAACSQGAADEPGPVVPETPNESNEVLDSDSVMVSLAPTSLEWEVSPMSRASSDDLYALIGYQSNDELEIGDTEMTQVILALFDDPTLISLKLAKNRYYHFVMTYVPNGKNVIERRGDGWCEPFTLPWDEDAIPDLNTVVYKRAFNTVGFCDYGDATPTGKKNSFVNEVLRYFGTYRNFKPEVNNQKIDIELYRWQYGIKITASDFYEGRVVFRCDDNKSSTLEMYGNSNGIATMEHYLQFPLNDNGDTKFSYNNPLEFADSFRRREKIDILYITPSNEEILLWSSGYNFPFKRMKMHTLEFSLSDAIVNGGISPDLMEAATDPMEEVNWEF